VLVNARTTLSQLETCAAQMDNSSIKTIANHNAQPDLHSMLLEAVLPLVLLDILFKEPTVSPLVLQERFRLTQELQAIVVLQDMS
jgi:hypothetical protein